MPPYSESEVMASMAEDDNPILALVTKLSDDTIPSSVSFSSESFASRDRSNSDSFGERRVAARPRRSRVQSMPAGSKGAQDFFGTPASDAFAKVNAPGRLDSRMISEGHVEGGEDEVMTTVIETKKVLAHPAREADEKNLKASPSPDLHADGKVNARCQCIIM